jgi:hypothetical protein
MRSAVRASRHVEDDVRQRCAVEVEDPAGEEHTG